MRTTENLGLNLVDGTDNARNSFDKYNENFQKIDKTISESSGEGGGLSIHHLNVSNEDTSTNYSMASIIKVSASFTYGGIYYEAVSEQLVVEIKDLLTGEVTGDSVSNSLYYIKAVNLQTITEDSAEGFCNLEIVRLDSIDSALEREVSSLNLILGTFETDDEGKYNPDTLQFYPKNRFDEKIDEINEKNQANLEKIAMVDRLIPTTVIFVEDDSFVLPKVIYNGALHEIINPVIKYAEGSYSTDVDYYIILNGIYEAMIAECLPSYKDEKLLATFRIDSVSGELKFTYQCNPLFVMNFTTKADIEYVNNAIERALATKANSNEVANAIKGTGTGTAIAFNDVSPLPHKTQIKGTANTQFQVVKGINLFKYAYDIGYTYTSESGLTTVINDGFVVHTQGTLTSASNVVILPNMAKKQILFPAGTYYFYADVSGTNTEKFVANLKVYDSNNVYKTLIQVYANTEKSVTYDYPFYLNLGAFGGRTNCAVGDEFDMDIKLLMTIARGHEYEPAKYDTVDGYTLDDNGMLEINAVSPSMTILADDEVSVEYNRDTNKIINQLIIDNENLKNAVTALGGTI